MLCWKPSRKFFFEFAKVKFYFAKVSRKLDILIVTGNRQCRAHGLQNARISCGEVNVRSRAYPLNTSDLWRFWRTFLEFCCGAYVFRYQRLLRGFALLLFGSSGAIGNSCRVELVGCLPFPSPVGLSSGWKALRVQQG